MPPFGKDNCEHESEPSVPIEMPSSPIRSPQQEQLLSPSPVGDATMLEYELSPPSPVSERPFACHRLLKYNKPQRRRRASHNAVTIMASMQEAEDMHKYSCSEPELSDYKTESSDEEKDPNAPPIEPIDLTKRPTRSCLKSAVKRVSSERCVSFTNLHIREYRQIIGDHPCCGAGPPLSLGWDFKSKDKLAINDYESTRCPRRSRRNLRLDSETRRELFVDKCEVRKAERKVYRNRQCRQRGPNMSKFFALPEAHE
eukprot:scaffold41196_cov63-Attheya_sp.AAC.4